MRKGLRPGGGMYVGKVTKRSTAAEARVRELGVGRQAQESAAGHVKCSVLSMTQNEMGKHRAVPSREPTGPGAVPVVGNS